MYVIGAKPGEWEGRGSSGIQCCVLYCSGRPISSQMYVVGAKPDGSSGIQYHAM